MRVWLLGAICALLLWQPAWAQQTLSPHEFREALIAEIMQARPDTEIGRRDPLSIVVRRPNDPELTEFTMHLDNGYAEYAANPEAQADILGRWTRLATMSPDEARLRERLVTVLRPRDTVEQFAAAVSAEAGAPPGLIWRPFAGDLVEMLAFDSAESIQYATSTTVAALALSEELAWAVAPDNLSERIGPLDVAGVEGTDNVAYVTGGNGLTPSTLADPRFCASEAGPSLIFLIVERNGYVMADRTDATALAEFRALYNDIVGAGEPFSRTPIACDGGRMRAVTLTD